MNELDAILKEINDTVANLQDYLGRGIAKDYAEYQNMCGKISGLLSTRRYIEDLKKHTEQSDE
jgi:hypothetical protein